MIIGASTSRAARGLLDWTQARLAAKAGVGLSTLKNFEAGRSLPSVENLIALQRELEREGVDFLPEGGVRLRLDPITFAADYRVDRYKFRLLAYRGKRQIVVDVPRETIDDAAEIRGASTAERETWFQAHRAALESCARDMILGQAADIERICLYYRIFQAWCWRHENPRT